ncbi:MAG TPA: winged helix-turn-helix domain-containing protein, partial [Aminobacteriaceae bacterium]|nr:winged helix-turn-helix domain-containing protein [Aminobacteriaceae bacterium]
MAKRRSEFVQWFGPVLDALRKLGGSGTPQEVSNCVAQTLNIPESKLNETIKSGASKFHNQVCWARQYLVWEGYIDGSLRGVWKLTKIGEEKRIDLEEARAIFLKWVDINAQKRKKKNGVPQIQENDLDDTDGEENEIDDDSSINVDYRQRVLSYLRSMTPKNFERFCLLLLRVNKFENLELTGGSHDEGIDGKAILRINPFVSFKV